MIRNYLFALADTADGGGMNIGTLLLTFGPIIILVGILYFFMIRPSKKQEAETQKMRENLQVGDEITTIGGIIGKVVSIKEDTCVIETSKDRTKIRILKSAVRSVDVPVEATRAPKPAEIKPEEKKPEETKRETNGNETELDPSGERKKKKSK